MRSVLFMLGLWTMLSAVLTACSIIPAEPAEERLPDIEPPKISQKPEMTVERGRIALTARGQGQVISEREENLFFSAGDKDASADGGQSQALKLKRLAVNPGDTVRKGALIAELDTKNLDLEAEKKRDQLKLEEHKLIAELRKVPENEAERIAQEQAKAAYREQARALAALERTLAGSRIYAPFDGEITRVFYKVGDSVKPYDPVATIIDPNALVVGVQVADKDLEHIRVGMPAEVEIGGLKEVYRGEVVRLPSSGSDSAPRDPFGPPSGSDERDKMVWIRLASPPEGLQAGAFARATFELLAKDNVVKIPRAYLNTYGGRTYVIVKDGDVKREVDVETGLETATEVEIIRGLSGGERIIGR
ncbi:MAG: efflux RND transporter periplasmic adaptor subunit [Hydrogenibacillus sp.]|nr:efflux RND transporter periplasmic adaptor subunit [Hydrogenibacillus sp.]